MNPQRSFWQSFEQCVRRQAQATALIQIQNSEQQVQQDLPFAQPATPATPAIAASPPAHSAPGIQSYSYQQLWSQALSLAKALKDMGIQSGDIVGLDLPRSADFIISVLGVWALGAVWIPLYGQAPARRQGILKECQPHLILTQDTPHTPTEIAPELHALNAIPCYNWKNLVQARSDRPPLLPYWPRPGDPAYLIYTSGSSGKPKGVLLPHDGLVTTLNAQIKAIGLAPHKRSLWCLSPLFDASISDWGTALLSGATLVIDADPLRELDYFIRLLQDFQIHYADIPPVLLSLLKPEAMPPELECLLIGGEAPPPEAVRRWSTALKLLNVYGPTEATICTSMGPCTPQWDRPRLGQPLPEVEYKDVDGELWIHSPGLALGYFKRPELSQSRFVSAEGKRWFRSGDRVERLSDGEYVFLGRLDRQFKQHGKLICPEEIERALRHASPKHQGPIAVVKHESGAVVAWSQQALPEHVRNTLAQSLPAWMHPQHYLCCADWPVGPTGKTDLQALTMQPLTVQNNTCFHAQTPLEKQLAALWQQVLKRKKLPELPHFFELGGSSLDVLALVVAAREVKLCLSPESVYAHPELHQLAQYLSGATNSAENRSEAQATQDLPTEAVLRAETICAHLPPDLPHSPSEARPNTALNPHKKHSLFFTGSTGFLGSRLLFELLDSTAWRFVCLVRADKPEVARKRVHQALRQWQQNTAQKGEQVMKPALEWDRIQVLCGDLGQAQFGLEATDWNTLSQLDAIVHCAAQVDLVRNYAQLAPVNLDPMPALYGLKLPLHYISTLSVLVGVSPKASIAREDDLLQNTHEVYGGYAQSKWAAEAWLLKQTAATPLKLYRPGLITADSQSGQGPSQDWLSALLQGLLHIGALPELPARTELAVDITPVDYAAKAIAMLMCRPAEGRQIYHLANPQALPIQSLWQILEQTWGLHTLPLAEWHTRLQAHSKSSTRDLSQSAALLALWKIFEAPPGEVQTTKQQARASAWHALNLFQATGIQLASPTSQNWLAAQDLVCPPPETALAPLLKRLQPQTRAAEALL